MHVHKSYIFPLAEFYIPHLKNVIIILVNKNIDTLQDDFCYFLHSTLNLSYMHKTPKRTHVHKAAFYLKAK